MHQNQMLLSEKQKCDTKIYKRFITELLKSNSFQSLFLKVDSVAFHQSPLKDTITLLI